LSGIRPATERLSERERTLILAILATPVPNRIGVELGGSDLCTLAQAVDASLGLLLCHEAAMG
jgi:hypothetical protein